MKPSRRTPLWVYMLECEDGSYYTGYTTNLTRRFRQHADGSANVKYTSARRPVRIVQCWRLFENVGWALKIERLIKNSGRKMKEKLVRDPTALVSVIESRIGTPVDISPFDPKRVEAASRRLRREEVRTAVDPFAFADDAPNPRTKNQPRKGRGTSRGPEQP